MLRSTAIGTGVRDYLEYLFDWFYREASQADHLSLPGLISRESTFLRGRDDPLKEAEWKKKQSDAVSEAVVLPLAFLSELITMFRWSDFRERAAYIWKILIHSLMDALELSPDVFSETRQNLGR